MDLISISGPTIRSYLWAIVVWKGKSSIVSEQWDSPYTSQLQLKIILSLGMRGFASPAEQKWSNFVTGFPAYTLNLLILQMLLPNHNRTRQSNQQHTKTGEQSTQHASTANIKTPAMDLPVRAKNCSEKFELTNPEGACQSLRPSLDAVSPTPV